jgi:hypothetical protein
MRMPVAGEAEGGWGPVPEGPAVPAPSRPAGLCLPVNVTGRSRAYLMHWLVNTICQDYDDGLTSQEREVLDRLRARLSHAVNPVTPEAIAQRLRGLDWTYPGYEHTYTGSGPDMQWFARLRDDPDAQPVPFIRGVHPASARFDRFPGEKRKGRRYA